MSESKHDDVLERNVEQLIARVHEPPRMNPDARARVLERVTAHARARVPEKPARALPRLGWKPAWAAGGVLAAGLAAVAVVALVTKGGGDPSVYSASEVRRVELADGSEMILNRGARAVVTGDRRVRIEAGDVLLDVAPGKGQFVVDAPHGELRVLGTRFVVVAGDDETRAAVVRGKVEARSSGGSAVLHAGEEAVLRDGKAPARRRAPRLSHLAGWAKLARRAEEKPAPGPARRGTLLARNPNWQTQEFPLPIRELKVDVYVENQIARVALDQTFFNPQNQQLEGVYHLALPHDASIYRQAMYVDGVKMESAVVARNEGRRIYEEIVYQQRDPALMEWMAGNLYKVRIFPLPARTEKRIVFGYTQPLTRLYDDYKIEVPLPSIDSAVDRVSFDVRLAGCARCQVASTSHDLTTAADGDDLVVTYRAERTEISDDLVLNVRDPQAAPRVVRAKRGDERYLMVRAQPDLGGAAALGEHRQKRWVILHDTSASRRPLERKAQAHLIDQLLRQLDEDDQVQVMAFDAGIRQMEGGFQRVDDVDRRAVAQFLTRESADGVGYTDLAAALRAATTALAAAGDDADPYVIYLGDGIVTAGERELERLRRAIEGQATFVGVAVGERMDMRVLRELADVTGGMTAVMNPGDDLGWRAFDLVAALSTPRVVDLEARLVDREGKTVDGEVYPSARQISDGEELSVVARLADDRAVALELRGRTGSGAWEHRIELPAARAGNARYLPRLWAQAHIDRLMRGDVAEASKEITELGVKNFLVTPFTSLLVLENDAMYRQYGVKRDRSKRWAEYALPDKIDVVTEPGGPSVGADPVAPLDAMLLRTPTRALQSYGAYDNTILLDGESSELFWNQGMVAGAFSLDVGGTGAGFGRGGGGGIRVTSEPSGATVTAALSTPVSDATAADEDGDMSSAIVTTESMSRSSDTWQVQLGTRGYRESAQVVNIPLASGEGQVAAGPRRNRGRYDAYDRLLGKKGKFRGPAFGGRDARWSAHSRAGYYYYYYGWQAPQPVAFHYPGDVRLDDLTEHVPGLYADSFDVEVRALLSGGDKGSITSDARSLIDASRKAIGDCRFHAGDELSLEVDRRGGLRVERNLDVGLGEEVLYDGAWLYHLYPQLGLATRRDAGTAGQVVYDRWAPFLLAPADALARWYDVTRPEPGMLRLVPAGADAARGAVEILLDDHRRVREIARVAGKERAVLLTATWHDDRVVVVQGGATTTLSFEDGGAVGGIDASAWAVVDMPLRQPAFLADKLEGATGPARRPIQRRLLAAWAAVGNVAKQIEVATEMAADQPLSRGELALVSRAARSMTKKQLDAITRGTDKDDVVAAYLRASHAQRDRADRGQLDRLAKRDPGFVGTLAAYRSVLARLSDYDHNRASADAKLVARLAERDIAPMFMYIATNMFANRYGWQQHDTTVKLWDALAASTDGAWRTHARFQAARWLYNRAKYNQAADRYEQVLADASDDDALPPLDRNAQWAFRSSARGEAGWRLFWGRWRDRALRRGDTGSLVALAQSATALGEQRDLDRVSARLIDVGTTDPDAALMVAQTLQMSGRAAQALAVLEPHLGGDDPELLTLASQIAEQQGRLSEAADYCRRALDGWGDEPVSLAQARSDYGRLLALYGRLAQTTGGAERAAHLEAATAIAARWRQVDPDNDQIDQTMARTLYAVGDPETAWRYLTGAVERHPGEGVAYQAVAQVLEEEGQVDKALPLWKRAAELEPESPVWLMREANALYALGDRAAADALVDRIAGGEWHERFRGTVYQAQQLKRQRK